METYTASLDTVSKIATGFVFLLLIYGILMSFFPEPTHKYLILIGITLPLITCTYLYRIVSYKITNDKLIINRPLALFNKEISLSDIDSVRLLTKEDFKRTIRTFGNGGLFGYTGSYANNKLGSFRMYATSGKNRILIVLKNHKGKMVISPDDTSMVDVLEMRLKDL